MRWSRTFHIIIRNLISNSGTVDEEIANRISKANKIYHQICNTEVSHRKLGKSAKLHIYKAINLPILLMVVKAGSCAINMPPESQELR